MPYKDGDEYTNIAVKKTIRDQMKKVSRETGLKMTRIVEDALKDYFGRLEMIDDMAKREEK